MIIQSYEFTPAMVAGLKVAKRKRGNQRSADRRSFIDCICAFDIETTILPDIENSIMYIWQFQIGEQLTVIGRYWSEYTEFINRFLAAIPSKAGIVVYVHNLSYEFQFLRGVYSFQESDVFAVDQRKVIKCTTHTGRVEYRCSLALTNMSLKEFTKRFHVKHQKLEDFEYTAARYPWTEITGRELEYCVNDVVGLVEAVQALLDRDQDNLYTVPMTSTGYVRREVRKAMREFPPTYIKSVVPDFELYKLLREAFRGGDTHANRYYTGCVLRDVHSYDRSSSYPDVICNCQFPVKPFVHLGPVDDLNYFRLKLLGQRHKAAIMRVRLEDVRLADDYWGCPYLAKAKCRDVVTDPGLPAFDNGRILNAISLETTITDVDLQILDREYKFKLTILDCWVSSYGPLPEPITRTVKQYYKNKTELKGVQGQENFYMKSKALLNSIYGMMAQDPVKINIYFRENDFVWDPDADLVEILENNNRKAFLAYQWGVWTTALARLRLHEGMWNVVDHGGEFVYCDTDSVKYFGDGVTWDELNDRLKAASTASGAAAADPSGKVHHMGVYEYEGTYDRFSTLGAKKYVCEHDGGNLEVTIAGVNKNAGAYELQKHGGIAAFKTGFVFRDAGGLEAIYNDGGHEPVTIDGHTVEVTSNVCLRPSTYTLGVTYEYMRLLQLTPIDIDRLFSRSQIIGII